MNFLPQKGAKPVKKSHYNDNIPSVTEIIAECGLYDFSGVPVDVLERAAQFGRAAHKACELLDKETLDMSTVNEPLIPYLDAWKKYKEYYNTVPLYVERRVKSKIWGYQGTLDRIMKMPAGLCVLDIKTTAKISPVVSIQTMAYKVAIEEETKTKIPFRACVQLKKDGTYVCQEYNDINDRNIWLSLVTLYKFKQKHNLIKGE
jgi:hypothetical protein